MRCRLVGSGSLVAIKMLKVEDGDADAAALRACAALEIRILQHLPHPNVITYIEVCLEPCHVGCVLHDCYMG